MPDSARRWRAPSNPARNAVPQDADSPRGGSRRTRRTSAREMVGEEVGGPRNLLIRHDDAVDVARHAPSALRERGSRWSPTTSAASAHCLRRAVVGHTTTTWRGLAARIAWHAARVLPAPGVPRAGSPAARGPCGVRGTRSARPGCVHAGPAPFSRLHRGHSAWPFAGVRPAAGAHRPHVIGMPALAAAGRHTPSSARARRGTGPPERT